MSTFFKSLGAIVAGFVTVFALSTLTDIVVEGVGIFPPSTEPDAYVWWMLLLALIYRIAFTILGGYITARLAPRKPLNHSIILGLIGTLGGIHRSDCRVALGESLVSHPAGCNSAAKYVVRRQAVCTSKVGRRLISSLSQSPHLRAPDFFPRL